MLYNACPKGIRTGPLFYHGFIHTQNVLSFLKNDSYIFIFYSRFFVETTVIICVTPVRKEQTAQFPLSAQKVRISRAKVRIKIDKRIAIFYEILYTGTITGQEACPMLGATLLRKYRYLSKIVISAVCVFCVISLLVGYSLFVQTYTEIQRQNDAFYLKSAAMLSSEFTNKMDMLRTHALTYSIRNDTDEKKIILTRLKANPYYLYEASTILSQYRMGLPEVADIGIAFYDDNIIVTTAYKYTLQEFSQRSAIPLSELQLLLENTQNSQLRLFSTFPQSTVNDGRLYCAFPIVLNTYEPAVFFYMLSVHSLFQSVFPSQFSQQPGCYILNSDADVFYATDTLNTTKEELSPFLADSSTSILPLSDSTLYKYENPIYNLYFVIEVPNTGISWNVFDTILNRNFFILIATVLLMLTGIVYISYNPIRKLVKTIHTNSEQADGEIGTILHAFGEIEGTVTQQKALLLEYLLINLLGGLPVSQEDRRLFRNFLNRKPILSVRWQAYGWIPPSVLLCASLCCNSAAA